MVIVAIAATLTAEAKYTDILKIARANSGIAALRTMKDGEHYTTLEHNSVVCTSYADKAERATLFTAACAVADYTLSNAEDMVLFPESQSVTPIYRHSYTANYALQNASATLATFEAVRDINFSPDDKYLAYCKGNNLYLYNIADSITTAVTDDGEWNNIINGTSDWVYEEEYGFTCAYTFIEGSNQIAYLRFDESQVPTFEMMRFDGRLYNHAYSFKYPKAGDSNSVVELWIYDIASGNKRRVDTGENSDQYIFNLKTTPSGELYFYRVNRLQNKFEVILLGKHRWCRCRGSSLRYVEEVS